MHASRTAVRVRHRLSFVLVAAPLVCLFASHAGAFDELNAAQSLIYDRPHLASSAAGDEIDYRYRARVGESAAIEDRARLRVAALADEERRDVTLDFLSEARRIELPPFEGYRGNPVLIAMLEHLARELALAAGGAPLYVRNRIRDALAREDTAIVEAEAALADGREVSATTLEFLPFRGDAYLGARPGIGDARFRIVLSDAVPGGVVAIGARSGESGETDDASGARFDYELAFDARRANADVGD